jgi:Na+/proline symporter
VRWGGLGVGLFCFVEAYNRVRGGSFTLNGFPPHVLMKIVAFIVGLVALLSFLFAMFQREQVKRDLDDRSCQALHIWWLPAAYWIPWGTFFCATGFRVVYLDPGGVIHSSYCFVYRSFLKDSSWGNRRVRWLTDAATGELPAAEV